MNKQFKALAGLSIVVVAGALTLANPASAKEGSSGNGKRRPDPVVVSTSCVESPVAAAWAGLTLTPWNATNTDTGEVWKFSFDDKGKVTYSRNGGPQIVAKYVQPLAIYDSNGALILSSPGAQVGANVPFVVPHSNCTMTWYTSEGPLFMVRT
jgi:hypothetical protein